MTHVRWRRSCKHATSEIVWTKDTTLYETALVKWYLAVTRQMMRLLQNQGAVSLTATDCPTWDGSFSYGQITWDDGPSLLVKQLPGVRFTTLCRALTAGLSLTLNLTTNSTIPVSQPLSCVSLSCPNLSLSLTSQFSQWSSSIETTSSDQSVNRKLQVLNLMFLVSLNSKVNTRSF